MRSAIVAMVSIFLVSEAHAQQPSAPKPQTPVVVLVYRAHDPFGLRLEGELRSIGVRVVARSRLTHATPAGTIAVATVFGEPRPRIEIRMGSHHAGDVDADVLVEVGDSDEALKTTKAAESVRAAIQLFVEAETARPSDVEPPADPIAQPPMPDVETPVPSKPAPPASTAEPSAIGGRPTAPPFAPLSASMPEKPRADPKRRLFSLSAGVSAIVGSQGTGFDVVSAAVVSPLSWLRFEPFLAIPFVPANLEAEGGSADLYAGLAGARIGFTIVRESVLTLDVGGGFAGVWLRAVGEPEDGYRGATVEGFTAAALADVTPRIDVYGGLQLVPRISLGVALPPPEIVFAGNDAGTWGAPFGELSLSADIAVFP
jgi:hypothetical protein